MSSVYVGPFARCHARMVDQQRERTSCTNPRCSEHTRGGAGAFCYRCGHPIGQVVYVVRDFEIDQREVCWANLGERLTGPGQSSFTWEREQQAHIYLPNRDMGGRSGHLPGYMDWDYTELTPADVAAEVATFEAFFEHELALLRSLYGAEHVEVRWGVIQTAD